MSRRRKGVFALLLGASLPSASVALSLGALSLSASTFGIGTAASGTILGATATSTITASGLPAGFTIDGAARTWAWDGTGVAATGLLTLTETLSGYGNSPRANALGYTIVGVLGTPTFLAYAGVGDTSLIGSYGAAESGVPDPPTFWFQFGSDVGEGDIVEFQIDTANTYDTGNLRAQSRVLLWTGAAFEFADPVTDVPGDFTIQTGLTPSTTYFMRRRIRRDYGDTSVYSAWSPDVTVSTAAAGITFALDATNHATWDAVDQLLINSNKTWEVQNGASGAHSSIRGLLPITGNGTKVFFEFIVDSFGASDSNGGFGVCTDTYGGTGGALQTVGNSEANLNQTALLWSTAGEVLVAAVGVDNPNIIFAATHRYGFALQVNVSDITMKLYKDAVPVGAAGGYSLPFTAVKPLISLNPTGGGTTQQISIASLAQATADCPTGYTPAGS